jgi:hypothetical protein
MNAMKKKLGPLQLWQWLAIGVALGVGTYLYRRSHPAATPLPLPADAAYNPIDPTTGLPYAGGFTTGASTLDPGAAQPGSFADMLEQFQQLEDLLAGLQSLTPEPGPPADTTASTAAVATGAAATKKKKPKKKPKHKRKPPQHGGNKNPGHHTTSHGHGRKSPSSSAPHNGRQHHNVAPPAHQRHPTTHSDASPLPRHVPLPTIAYPANPYAPAALPAALLPPPTPAWAHPQMTSSVKGS